MSCNGKHPDIQDEKHVSNSTSPLSSTPTRNEQDSRNDKRKQPAVQFMTHHQGEVLINLVTETNNLLNRFLHTTKTSRKKIRFDESNTVTQNPSISASPINDSVSSEHVDNIGTEPASWAPNQHRVH